MQGNWSNDPDYIRGLNVYNYNKWRRRQAAVAKWESQENARLRNLRDCYITGEDPAKYKKAVPHPDLGLWEDEDVIIEESLDQLVQRARAGRFRDGK